MRLNLITPRPFGLFLWLLHFSVFLILFFFMPFYLSMLGLLFILISFYHAWPYFSLSGNIAYGLEKSCDHKWTLQRNTKEKIEVVVLKFIVTEWLMVLTLQDVLSSKKYRIFLTKHFVSDVEDYRALARDLKLSFR